MTPLKIVVFNQATSVPGTSIMMVTVEALARRLVGGVDYICPQPYLNEQRDRVVIGDREYPLSRVHYYERAKMAKSVPEPREPQDYTVPRRVVVTVPAQGAVKQVKPKA